jgi:arylsulfatase
MNMNRRFLMQWGGALWAAFALTTASSFAQQTTGTPGSPDATTTISGKQLPPPDPKFGGVIRENLAQSKSWWAPRIAPPRVRQTSC